MSIQLSPDLAMDEIVRRGTELYEQLLPQVEPGNRGKFLIIDVQTGNYEIDADDFTATERLIAKNPAAMTYGMRIGYDAAYAMGGYFSDETP